MRAVRCLLLILLLAALSTASGLCPDRWLLFRDRCLGVFPVWASWSSAETLCSQSGSHLLSLDSKKQLRFLQKILTKLEVPVWTGGYSVQSDFHPKIWTNHTSVGCLGLEGGEVRSAPCGELRFYICSRKTSSKSNDEVVVSSGLSPGVSLFSLMWAQSETVAEEILHSSSFLLQLKSGSISQSCYDRYRQQEALYMGLVYRTLQALSFHSEEVDPGVKSLLLDTKHFYQSRLSKQDLSAAPRWLQFALQSFHSVVTDEPVYLVVALSARSALNSFILHSLPLPLTWSKSGSQSRSLLLKWREESERELKFTHRFREVIERLQSEMDEFKAINVFRVHMMNQKSLHKHLECQ